MEKAMIITVGIGPSVAHGICFSIKQQNPDFVMFLVTQESKEKTIPIIVQNEVIRGKDRKEILISDPKDVEKIAKKVEEIFIKELKKYKPQDIVIDYTSGTKPMSAGVVITGIKLKVGTLVYITGNRDERGTVISGTERPFSLEPNCIYADDLWMKAVDLFNKFQYDTCIKIISEAKLLLADKEFQHKIQTFETLAKAYSRWDKFDLQKAFEKLDSLTGNKFLPVWGVKSQIKENKGSLYREKDNPFCKERVADLIKNAERRREEKKFDDAMARLYRTIEYIAQYKVNEKKLFKKDEKGKIQTDNLDVETLPLDLRQKYEQYRNPKDNKIKLSLYKLYELLKDLNEEIGENFMKEIADKDSKLKKLLQIRNKSVLAHGFKPVKEEEFSEMLNITQKLAETVIQISDTEKVKFPTIKV